MNNGFTWPFLDCGLAGVEGLTWSSDLKRYVVWSYMLLVVSPKANRSKKTCTLPGIGLPGPTPGARPGGGVRREALGGLAAHMTSYGDELN